MNDYTYQEYTERAQHISVLLAIYREFGLILGFFCYQNVPVQVLAFLGFILTGVVSYKHPWRLYVERSCYVLAMICYYNMTQNPAGYALIIAGALIWLIHWALIKKINSM